MACWWTPYKVGRSRDLANETPSRRYRSPSGGPGLPPLKYLQRKSAVFGTGHAQDHPLHVGRLCPFTLNSTASRIPSYTIKPNFCDSSRLLAKSSNAQRVLAMYSRSLASLHTGPMRVVASYVQRHAAVPDVSWPILSLN